MIERLNGRAAVGIAAIGLLLVVLIGWFGVVSPQRSKAADLAVRIDDTELQLETTQALVDGPQLRLSTAELATLRTAIPDEVRMSQILRQLSKASGDARVRILGITPTAPLSIGGANVVPINLSVEGRYFGIRNFLRLLRTRADLRTDKVRASGRLFAIDSIQFAGAGAASGGGLIQATLSVTAFSFSDQVAVPTTGVGGATPEGVAVESGTETATP